jgi:hypothetical protein
MITQCTNPAAPFYQADLLILSILEGNGFDVSCNVITGLTSASLISIAALVLFTVYATAKLVKGLVE